MTSSKISFSVDLVEAAISEHEFMKDVEHFGDLYRGPLLSNAIRRYEHLWLPLICEEEINNVAAPVDVEWVWHLHMLSPRVYESDCKRLLSKIIDHKVLVGDKKKKALEKSAQLWRKRYPGEPFDVDLNSISSIGAAESSDLSCDLMRAAWCQKNFYYQVSLPHYHDRKFLKNAVKRYKQFLQLQSKAKSDVLVPTQDIDFIWHTHIVHPLAYKKDCSKAFESGFDHEQDDHSLTFDPTTLCAATITREHWNREYNDSYALTGTTVRREPPPPVSKCTSDPYQDLATPIYTLKLIKAEVNDLPIETKYTLSLSQTCTTNIEKIVTTVNGTVSCCNETNGLVSFTSSAIHADAPMMLTAKLNLTGTTKTSSTPLLFFPESLDAVLKENDVTRPKVSKRVFKVIPPGCNDVGKVSLTFQILPPLRIGNFTFHVNQYDSDFEVPDLSTGLAHPFSVSPTLSDEGPCRVALFGINSYSGVEVFRCRVVESLAPLSSLAVEISQLNGRVIASSHSVSKGELPYKGQVSKRLDGFPYQNNKPEPKILVRGRKDWGICYAQKTVSSKIKLYLYDLENKEKIEIQQPSKTMYKFKLENSQEFITVDSMSGDIEIPRCVSAIPEVLALCFSFRTLKSSIEDIDEWY